VQKFKDPLEGKIKQDYSDKNEEIKEEDIIMKEIETTLTIIPTY